MYVRFNDDSKGAETTRTKNLEQRRLPSGMVTKTDYFPLEIPLKAITAKALLNHFSEIQDAIYTLRQDSQKHSYAIRDKVISHRQLGEQKIPVAMVFNNEAIFVNYLSKQDEFEQFKHLAQLSLLQDGLLFDWLIRYPLKVMQHAEAWPQLLKVCRYFESHPQPDCYIRQLDIQGVDSKFIEKNKGILSELLTQKLPATDYHVEITGLSQHGFERRYGLRYEQPTIRLRILDAALAVNGLTDISLTVSEFRQFNIAVDTVFIAENKINGLAFPDYPRAMVIFGLGYAVNLLAAAYCLQARTIYYWGDIDTNGFAILSQLRHYYPEVRSLLMDETTLEQFDDLSVLEPRASSKQGVLSHLTKAENQLYQQLQENLKRLEQERISYSYLQKQLLKLSEQ